MSFTVNISSAYGLLTSTIAPLSGALIFTGTNTSTEPAVSFINEPKASYIVIPRILNNTYDIEMSVTIAGITPNCFPQQSVEMSLNQAGIVPSLNIVVLPIKGTLCPGGDWEVPPGITHIGYGKNQVLFGDHRYFLAVGPGVLVPGGIPQVRLENISLIFNIHPK